MAADFWLSSVAGIAATGEFAGNDATGTRIGGWLASKKAVLVAGVNKIVKDASQLQARLDYNLAVESARARFVYGVPGSASNNVLTVNAGNPYGPGHFEIVLVKQNFGY